MALDLFDTLDVIAIMENFMLYKRPPEHMRDKIDLSYKIENQSIIIFEIRPHWKNPEEVLESDVAKTTYIKVKKEWHVYWKRANGNWDPYPLEPIVATLEDFLRLVDEDKGACFWG